jgi:hypothetical protein
MRSCPNASPGGTTRRADMTPRRRRPFGRSENAEESERERELVERLDGIQGQLEQVARRADEIERHNAASVVARASQQRAMEGLEARVAELELAQRVWSVMAYVRDTAVDEKTCVSVILATRNRSEYVPRAVESVLAQSYPNWELVAVDDGSDDDTSAVLATFDEDRIRRFRTSHRGLSAARNHALAKASGDYVAYIDDDNTMHPDWLRSIVWAFKRWPHVDLLYGATIIDGAASTPEVGGNGTPWLQFVPYDRARLEQHNPTDIGAIAHRAGLPEAVFDEELEALMDWDLLLRAARARDLLALPVVAGAYNTSAPHRLSTSGIEEREMPRLRSKRTRSGNTPAPKLEPTD